MELVEASDKNHDGLIDYTEWESMGKHCISDGSNVWNNVRLVVEHIRKVFPSAKEHIAKVSVVICVFDRLDLTTVNKARELFVRYDLNEDSVLGLNELAELLQHIGNKLTSLPAVCFPASAFFSHAQL